VGVVGSGSIAGRVSPPNLGGDTLTCDTFITRYKAWRVVSQFQTKNFFAA
jgi:hypothetical protein